MANETPTVAPKKRTQTTKTAPLSAEEASWKEKYEALDKEFFEYRKRIEDVVDLEEWIVALHCDHTESEKLLQEYRWELERLQDKRIRSYYQTKDSIVSVRILLALILIVLALACAIGI